MLPVCCGYRIVCCTDASVHVCSGLCVQGGLTFLAVMRYRQGVSEQFASGIDQDQVGAGGQPQPTPSPYSAYPSAQPGGGGGMGGDSGDPYQQGPFSQAPPMESKQAPGDFQPPTY